MALEASVLTVRVQSDGIENTTKALNDLAAAGEKAEKKTSNIGSGAQASAKAQVDAAQQAASAYNAIIDMMTEKSNTFYQDKAMKAAMAAQQELFDGMSMMDKLWAHAEETRQKEAAARAKEAEDIRNRQAQQLADATAASEKALAIQFDAYQKQKQMEANAQAKGDALNQAGQRAADYAKLQADIKALKEETDKLRAAEKAEQEQREKIDYADWIARGKAAAQATREQEAALSAQQKAESQAKAEGEAFVKMLERRAATVGMTTKQIREYNLELLRNEAAEKGVSAAAAEHINQLGKARGAHESLNFLTAGSARELMVLGHELSQGQFQRFGGSLIVLGERINFIPGALERAGQAAAALGVSTGMVVTGFLAALAAVGAFVYAIYKGSAEQREFNAALILSGNYAGMTADNMESMAQSVGKANGSIGAAKKTIVELAGSGKFTADQILLISDAVVAVEHATGKSGETMIGEFEKLATMAITSSKRSYDEISRHVMELNDKYHFLTAAQYDHISALDKQGKSQEAANEAEEAYANAMKRRADEIQENLGSIQRAWIHVKEVASEGWDAMLGIGKKVTPQDEIDRLKGVLETMDSRPAWFSGRGQGGGAQKQFDESRLRIVMALTAAVEEKNKADAAAIKQGQDLRDQQAGIHAMSRNDAIMQQVSKQSAGERALAEEKVNNELAKRAIALDKLSQDPEIVKKALESEKKYTDEAIADREKKITEFYAKKGPKPHTEGMSGLDKEINELNEQYEVQKRAMDNKIKLIDFQNKYGLMEDEKAQSEKEDLLDQELKLEKDHLQKALDAIKAFHTEDVRLKNDAASKKTNIQKQLDKVMSDIALKQKENDLVPDVNLAAEQVKQQKEQDNILKQIEKQTASVQAQVDAYNNLPDAVKAVGVRQKEMASEVEQARIDSLEVEKEKLLNMDAMYTIVNQRRIDQIDKEIAARQKLKGVDVAKEANDKQNNAALNRSTELTKIATQQVRMWKDIGSEIEKSLKNAFGAGGEAAGKMFRAFAEGQADQIDLIDKIRLVKTKDGLSDEERTKQINELQLQGAQNQLGMYGDMAGAASMFFEKGSTGYQAMAKAAMVLHTAEVALSLIKGVNAILTQGEGDPYTAFARMAAMTALVAGLGVAVSGGGSGPMTSANQQKVQGTGTVLGSPTIVNGVDVRLVGQKSESIANSLKIAEKNSGLGLVVQNDMLDALRKLSNSISSFAILAVQNSGLTGYTASNSQSFGGKGIALAGAAAGGVGGAMLGTYLGMGMASIGGPLGLAIGAVLGSLLGHGIVGKAMSSIFGGSKSVDDTGLTIGKTSLGQVASGGLTGQQYTNITTSGGWFRSDKHNTETQSLGSEFNDQITKVVLSMEDTLKTAAVGLGVGGDAFDEKLKSFVVDIGNISLKGMTGDEIQSTLMNVFSKLGDQMAQFAFSDLQKYQKIGEGLMETVVRVANDLQQVKDVFDSLSKTIPAAVDAIATSEALIEQFGSVDNLTKGVKSYINAIYTEEDKLAPVTKSVTEAMGKLNLSGVQTKQQFKQVVDSIDLTTSSGRDLFEALMNIAPAFGQAVDAAKKAANDLASNILSDVDTAFNMLSKMVSKQKDEISNAADAAKEAAQKQLDAAKDVQTAVQTVFDAISNALKGTIDDSAAVTKARRQEAQAYIAVATASAAAGNDVSKMGGLQDALDSLSAPSKDMYGSYQEYALDQAKTGYALTKLQSATKGQLDYAKLTVSKLDDTIKAIEDQKTSQTKALDNILIKAQDQIDVLKGQSSSLLTIAQGIAALNNAIQKGYSNTTVAGNSAINTVYQNALGRPADAAGAAYWNSQIANGVPIKDVTKAISTSDEARAAVEQLYKNILHRSSDMAGMDFFLDALSRGSNLNDIAAAMKDSPEYKNLPSFAVGTNNLPEDMIAQLHKGERIIPAADNAALQRKLDSSDDNSASVAEVSAKLDQLITVVVSGDVSNANMTRELVKIIKRWDTEGQPETRDVVA
jgi:hypothetical protein